MNIKEARKLLESHSVTKDDYSGFHTVTRKRQGYRAIYIPIDIVTMQEKTYRTTSTFNHFVVKVVTFAKDGTYTVSDTTNTIPIAEVDEMLTVGGWAEERQRNYARSNAVQERVAQLPSLQEISDTLGLGGASITIHDGTTAPFFTVTLTLSQIEALLNTKAGK